MSAGGIEEAAGVLPGQFRAPGRRFSWSPRLENGRSELADPDHKQIPTPGGQYTHHLPMVSIHLTLLFRRVAISLRGDLG